MRTFTFRLKTVPPTLKAGFDAVHLDHASRFGMGKGALALTFVEETGLGPDTLESAADRDGGG